MFNYRANGFSGHRTPSKAARRPAGGGSINFSHARLGFMVVLALVQPYNHCMRWTILCLILVGYMNEGDRLVGLTGESGITSDRVSPGGMYTYEMS